MRLIHAVSLVQIQVPRPFLCYNIDMSKRKGFTFIEISLFLAVTAALFIGVGLGVNNSIFQQQYNDTTQDFFEFLRSVYSKVSNPQSVGEGNSGYAIYGKLIVFGESVDLLGNAVPANEQQFFTYDVVGSATSTGTGDIKSLLKGLGVNVVFLGRNAGNKITGINLASPEKYVPHWGAAIETTGRQAIKRSILVVRHPRSGTINTLVYNDAVEVNKIVRDASASCMYQTSCTTVTDLLTSKIDSFNVSEMDFCVNPYGLNIRGGEPRRDVRILENARNASSVQLIDLEGSDNRCL